MRNFIDKTVFILSLGLGIVMSTLSQAGSLHGASNIAILQAACPDAWEKVDVELAQPATVPWANAADQNKHIEFQQNFLIPTTKTGSRDEVAVSLDVITVLSECIKRHNIAVQVEFKKVIGATPALNPKLDSDIIVQLLLLMSESVDSN